MSDERKPGRPKSEDPGSAVTTWIPCTLHDQLIQLAKQNGNSLSATVRVILEKRAK